MRLYKIFLFITITMVILIETATVPSFSKLVYTQDNDMGTVRLKAGTCFYVYLPDDPTDSYQWVHIPPRAPMELDPIDSGYIPPKKAGGQGTRWLKFQVPMTNPWDLPGDTYYVVLGYMSYSSSLPPITNSFYLNIQAYYPGGKQK